MSGQRGKGHASSTLLGSCTFVLDATVDLASADVSINTVNKLLIDAGRACAAFHDENARDVKACRVQVDQIWSFT